MPDTPDTDTPGPSFRERAGGHLRRHGLKYAGVATLAALAGGGLWAWNTIFSSDDNGEDGSSETPTREVTPAAASDDPIFGPRTIWVEKYVDANNDGVADEGTETVQFRATYTERPSGNTMVLSANGITHELVDNEDFTPLEHMTSGSTIRDTLEAVTVAYHGNQHRFVAANLDPATIYGETGLALLEEANVDYNGVRERFGDHRAAELREVTTDAFSIPDTELGDLRYRTIDAPTAGTTADPAMGPPAPEYREIAEPSSE